ncbi:MAG: polyprenyl synthetase family protein [Byssovorax sp.]
MTKSAAIREDLEAPVARIGRRIDEAIARMAPYGGSPVWRDAVSAALAISHGPRHLVRAQLVLLGSIAGGGGPAGERIERFATGVELLHLFMLVHDDVMDNATLRRGKPTLGLAIQAADRTIGWLEARDLAVLMGDMLNVLAMRHLAPGVGATTGDVAACELLLDACARAGVGQFHDLLGLQRLGDNEAAFRREILDKTAYQAFAAPFAAGLVLARPDADPTEALAWGHRLGRAFQVLGDLTDLVAPPAVTGKDGLRNLLEGRPSLPLLFLHERTSGDDRELVESIVGKKTMELGERALLADLIARHEIVEACSTWARAEIAEAAQASAASAFAPEARAGMAAVEQSLREHLDEVVAHAARWREED